MKLKKNIALVGKMHAGKSTVAEVFANLFGYGRWAFALPVKELGDKALSHIIDPHLREVTGKNLPASKALRRGIYQFVGAYGRQYSNDIWVNEFQRRFTRGGSPRGIVIEDMRYLNEAAWAKIHDFVVIKIIRPEEERLASINKAFQMDWGREPTEWELQAMLNHESETEVDSIVWDYEIMNDLDIPWLRNQVEIIMADL